MRRSGECSVMNGENNLVSILSLIQRTILKFNIAS